MHTHTSRMVGELFPPSSEPKKSLFGMSPEKSTGEPSRLKQMDPGVWPGVQMVWSRRRPTWMTDSSSRMSS